jgi:hypothetical protein
MNWFEILAIVGMPLILFLLGFAALKWTQWDINRRDRLHPGE